MTKTVIKLSNPREVIPLAFSIKERFDLHMSPVRNEISLGVTNFPSFKNIVVNEDMALLQNAITFNVQVQSLLAHVDPWNMKSVMDNSSLAQLDIKENYNIASIS